MRCLLDLPEIVADPVHDNPEHFGLVRVGVARLRDTITHAKSRFDPPSMASNRRDAHPPRYKARGFRGSLLGRDEDVHPLSCLGARDRSSDQRCAKVTNASSRLGFHDNVHWDIPDLETGFRTWL